MARTNRILALATLALLAGCATRTTAPPPRPITVLPSSLAADRYLPAVASASLFAIRASQVMASRGGRLGGFARQAMADHQGIGSQLNYAGRHLDLLPSATLSSLHQSMLSELEASSNPDVTYRRQMGIVLGQAYALHNQFQRSGSSATLRPVAAMAAPIVARELAALRAL